MENFSDIGLMHKCWRMNMDYPEYVMTALDQGEFIHLPSAYGLYCYVCDEHYGITQEVDEFFKL